MTATWRKKNSAEQDNQEPKKTLTFMSLKPRLTRLLLEALQCEADSFNVQILLGGLLLFKKVLGWMWQGSLYFFVCPMKKKNACCILIDILTRQCRITCLYTNNSNILYLILSILSPQPPKRQVLIDSEIIYQGSRPMC